MAGDIRRATGVLLSFHTIHSLSNQMVFVRPLLMDRAGYQQVFKEGHVKDYALNLRHRDGRTMPVLYNASVYRDMEGQDGLVRHPLDWKPQDQAYACLEVADSGCRMGADALDKLF